VKIPISSPDAPKAVGPYSPAIRSGPFLFLAGQIALDPKTGQLIDGDASAQTRQVLDNLGALLKTAGLSFAHVVRTTVLLADLNDMPAVNAVYVKYFPEPLPARVTVQVARIPRDGLVEIDAIAECEGGTSR
jgi:2-iminobutanoate/2-iminopropanoate deaminase